MGGMLGKISKDVGSIVKLAGVDPGMKIALQSYPKELTELKIGRLLSEFEGQALMRGLEQRGLLPNAATTTPPTHTGGGMFGNFGGLLKGLEGMQILKSNMGVGQALQGMRFPPAMLTLVKDLRFQYKDVLEISENFDAMGNTQGLA